MNKRILEAILKLGLDRESIKQAQQPIESLEKHLEKLEREGGSVRVELMRTFAAVRSGALAADKAVEQLDKQMKALDEHGDRVRNFAGYLGEIGAGMAGVGALVAGPLVLAANQYVNAVGKADDVCREWLASVEDIERSQLRIGKVAAEQLLPFLEKAADLAEQAAEFAEDHPGVVQAALGIGGILLAGGGLAAATAKTIQLVAAAQGMVATATQLLASKLLTGAGGTGGLGGVGVGKGAMLAGSVAAGIGAGAYISNKITGDEDTAGRFLRQSIALPGAAASSFLIPLYEKMGLISPETAKNLSEGFGKIYDTFGNTGAVAGLSELGQFLGIVSDEGPAAGEAVKKVADGFYRLSQSEDAEQILESWVQFQEEQKRAEERYSKERTRLITEGEAERVRTTQAQEERRIQMIAEFEGQRAGEEANWNLQRARELRDFNRAEEQIQRDHLAAMNTLADQAREDATRAENRHKAEVTRFLDQENKAEQATEADYYKRRRKVVAQANDEEQEAEAEHQKRMRRMQEDHRLSIEDALRAQDAIAFLAEQRNYERERQRAEEDYQNQAKQRGSENAQALAEMEADFQAQRGQRQKEREARVAEMETQFQVEKTEREKQVAARQAEMQKEAEDDKARRQAEFDLKRKDDEEDFSREQEQKQKQFDERLAKQDEQDRQELSTLAEKNRQALSALQASHREEQRLREQAFTDQVRALDAALLGEKEAREQHYEQMAEQLDAWLQRMQQSADRRLSSSAGGGSDTETSGPASPAYPGRARGGYATRGKYELGERGYEFVMNNPATKLAESMLGGPLTQDRLLGALASGGSNSRSFSYSQQNVFNERMDARQIVSQVMSQMRREMRKVERGW